MMPSKIPVNGPLCEHRADLTNNMCKPWMADRVCCIAATALTSWYSSSITKKDLGNYKNTFINVHIHYIITDTIMHTLNCIVS